MPTAEQVKEEFINSNMSVEEYHRQLRECKSMGLEAGSQIISELTIKDVRNLLVNIQIGLSRTRSIIDGIIGADGVAEEMEDDPDEDHPLISNTLTPTVGPVELRRAVDLMKGMGYKPLNDLDGNRLEVGDMVGFTIAGPDAYNHLKGVVSRVDDEYYVDCGTPGLIRIDNDLLKLHKLPDEDAKSADYVKSELVIQGMGLIDAEEVVSELRAQEQCGMRHPTILTVSEDRAQTGEEIGYTDRSIWLCPRCVIAITNLEYVHLNLNGCCDECETKLEQYEKVEWRP